MTRSEYLKAKAASRKINDAEKALALAIMVGNREAIEAARKNLERLANQTGMKDFVA